jgi:amidohydrolase
MPTPTDGALAPLLAAVEHELTAAVELRHRLHAQPELAHEERWTGDEVQRALPAGADTVAGTGRIALIGAGESPVAVRAELDGLPLRERTGASYSAQGETMHACGHDVHMAALVALARAAHGLRDLLPAPLLAVFQPSEEAYPSGAQLLVEAELAQAGPAAVVAAHVHPGLAWGSVALDAGPVNASCDAIEITVAGRPSHGAYPHLGSDPVLALAEVVVALHAQLGRRIDPQSPAVLTIGVLDAPGAENVIPGQALARGALRAQRPAEREALREMVEQVVAGTAAAAGCEGRVRLVPGEPPLDNDPAIVERALALLPAAGLERAPEWRSSGSDDFAFFGEAAPIAMAFVGLAGAPGFHERPLHHPELLPPDEAVGAVARTLAVLYCAAAARSPS